MKTLKKILNIEIGIIYVLIAVALTVSVVSRFTLIKDRLSDNQVSILFLPLLLMFIIVGVEVCRLVKKKYSVYDALKNLIFPLVILFIILATSERTRSGNDWTFMIKNAVSVFYFFEAVKIIVIDIAIVFLALMGTVYYQEFSESWWYAREEYILRELEEED